MSDTTPKLERILVRICDSKLGDIMMATPTFAGIRQAHPQAHITLLLRHPHPGDWVKRLPEIDEILWEDRKGEMHGLFGALRLLSRVKARRFDAAIDLRLRSRYAWLYWFARIPIRSASSTKYYARLLTHNIPYNFDFPDRHEAEYNYGITEPIGVTGKPGSYFMPLTEEEAVEGARLLAEAGTQPGERFLALNPTFGGSSRLWPPDRFAEVARQVAARTGIRIVLIGGPDSVEANAALMGELPAGTINLTGKTSIPVLAAVLRHAALHLSIDTGTSHLAAAMGTPCVTVFPFMEYWEQAIRWKPWATPVRAVGPTRRCPSCPPAPGCCLRKENICIDSVPTAGVVQAALELLSKPISEPAVKSPYLGIVPCEVMR